MSDKKSPAAETMKKAEEQNPLVEEAKDDPNLPKRDTDEFTDQHLKAPEVDPEIEKVSNQDDEA